VVLNAAPLLGKGRGGLASSGCEGYGGGESSD